MFRKKPDIPQEPVIPTHEQILEDVLNSADDDIVFNVSSEGVDAIDERSLTTKGNVSFEKVRAFVELNENLKQCFQQLSSKSESLKISDCELRAMADDIRKKSIEALQ